MRLLPKHHHPALPSRETGWPARDHAGQRNLLFELDWRWTNRRRTSVVRLVGCSWNHLPSEGVRNGASACTVREQEALNSTLLEDHRVYGSYSGRGYDILICDSKGHRMRRVLFSLSFSTGSFFVGVGLPYCPLPNGLRLCNLFWSMIDGLGLWAIDETTGLSVDSRTLLFLGMLV